MKNKELAEKMSRNFGKLKLGFIKHSPEILMVTGIVGMAASAVLACKATTKLDSIISKAKNDIKPSKIVQSIPKTCLSNIQKRIAKRI